MSRVEFEALESLQIGRESCTGESGGGVGEEELSRELEVEKRSGRVELSGEQREGILGRGGAGVKWTQFYRDWETLIDCSISGENGATLDDPKLAIGGCLGEDREREGVDVRLNNGIGEG